MTLEAVKVEPKNIRTRFYDGPSVFALPDPTKTQIIEGVKLLKLRAAKAYLSVEVHQLDHASERGGVRYHTMNGVDLQRVDVHYPDSTVRVFLNGRLKDSEHETDTTGHRLATVFGYDQKNSTSDPSTSTPNEVNPNSLPLVRIPSGVFLF